MTELDPRIVKVTIDIDGTLTTFSDIYITAQGTKYGNALQNEAEITLTNLDKTTQDYILTETSPYNANRTPKTVTLEAGRESYGTAVIFKGNVVTSMVSQPPDLGVTLKCLTGNFIKGNVLTRTQPGQASLSQISKQIAQDTETTLSFEAGDRSISNYAYAGAALKQIDVLGALGGINVFIDDDVLVVKDAWVPRNNTLRVLSAETGMIGIPQFTEQGIRVKFLLDNRTKLGSALEIQSDIYPAANGTYVIYKLGFQIANRENPFYYIAEAARQR